ncbi:hypothetical protein [Gorillibacterium timonense]|uniref:hypothetical protein n=1 Tax=Gorillibacterium timonense TaxID=1689269 RepID=UPI00071CF46E|nr:hypothetical protein [Gorillibacterium timonense]
MKKTANRTLLLAIIGGCLILSACSDRQGTADRGSVAVSPSPAIQKNAAYKSTDSPEALRQLALTQAAAAAGQSLNELEVQATNPDFPIEAPTFPAPSHPH